MGWTGIDPAQWASRAKRLDVALLRNSVQELAKEASKTIPNGGRVPVLTGNLGRSVVISATPPMMDKAGTIRTTAQNFSLGVAELEPGKPVYIGWQAVYARRQNYGFVGADSLGRVYNQAGHGFAEAAAEQWPTIVIREASKLANK